MKSSRLLALAAVILAVCSTFVLAQEKPWFDLQNCSFCKHLMTDPKLMENMTWDHYDISNGVVSVTTVNPEFMASFKKAMDEMEKVGQEMTKGKADVSMCGSCEYYGKMMQAGAKIEYVPTKTGVIVLIISDKPAVIDMIKTYGQRNREELAKWEAQEKAKK